MGLDQDLMLVRDYLYGYNGVQPTLVDGFPLEKQYMRVVTWRKNHWVHQFMCSRVRALGANDCQEIEVEPDELELLADTLEKWIEDPNVLPPIDDKLRGPFFGVYEHDAEYEESRDLYRQDAKEDVKKIREALKWLKQKKRKGGAGVCRSEWRHAVYKVSW